MGVFDPHTNNYMPKQFDWEADKCKRALLALRKLFTEAHRQGHLRQVWHLVSALRGPDFDVNETHICTPLKSAYTTPIRKALLTTDQALMLSVSDAPSYKAQYAMPEGVSVTDDDHFKSHILLAMRVLKNCPQYAKYCPHTHDFTI